jgi:ribosome-binding factor A
MGMLPGRRATRIGDQVLREMADLLMRRVKDPRVKGITLTGILISNDLKYARVYYSVMGEEKAILQAQAGLDSAKGYIKREIGLRLELKYMPDLVFKHDPSLAAGEHMEKLFQQIKKEESSGSGEQKE